MKPDFALNLTHESIGLLHRTSRGWSEVGIAELDAPDLGEALGFLRRSALGLSPSGFTSKLIIPNTQILYDLIDAPGPTDAKRRNQIKKALEGRTPYAVKDLVFDWSGDGPQVKVAIVARETLDEAEHFAAQHKFNPVSFVAIPQGDDFEGEPFFGAISAPLANGEKVERDIVPVVILTREPMVQTAAAPPELQDAPPPEALPETPDVPAQSEPVFDNLAGVGVVDDIVADNDWATAWTASDTPATPPDATENDQAATSDIMPPAPLADAADVPAPAAPDDVDLSVDVVEPALDVSSAGTETVASPAAPIGWVPFDDAPDAPLALDVDSDPDDTVESLPGIAAPNQSDVADQPSLPAFASRRRAPDDDATGNPGPDAPVPSDPDPGTSAWPINQPSQDRVSRLPPPPRDAVPPKPAPARTLPPGAARVTAPGIAGLSPDRRPKVMAPVPDPRKSLAAGSPPPMPVQSSVRPARPQKANAFGLGSGPSPVRGKPKYLGLILTGLLLLALAVAAAMSSFYLASRDAPAEPGAVQTANSAAPVQAEPEPPTVDLPDIASLDVPAVDDEMLADAQDPADLAPQVATPDAVVEDVAVASDAIPPLVSEPVVVASPNVPPDAGTQAEAEPDPSSNVQDEIFLAARDSPPPVRAAVTLPVAAARPEQLPVLPMAPPPFGTVYQFDAQGRIIPTAEGVITPDGITLFSGRPAKLPLARPTSLTVATASSGLVPPGVDPALPPDAPTATQALVADPALAGSRPRARPASLTPPVAETPVPDDAALSPPPAADIRLAGSRPRARPAGVVDVAVTAQQSTAGASLAAFAANGPISPLALGLSQRPAPRPGNFSKAVEAAVAAAVRDAPPEPAPEPPIEVAAAEPAPQATLRVRKPTPADEPTIASAPEADDEPEADTRSGGAASSGTVAQQATFANAINLSKVNLIGVYGTSNARYALIRQSNGRYKKVKVGDRFDGGVVAAINASEVRYQKSGRMYALTLPTG